MAAASLNDRASEDEVSSPSSFFILKNTDVRDIRDVNSGNQIFYNPGSVTFCSPCTEPSIDELVFWLHFNTIYKAIHDMAYRSSAPNTGIWFLKSKEYGLWVEGDEPHSWNLVCQGIHGAGKTTIASIVVEDLRRVNLSRSKSLVLYAYFRYDTQALQTEDVVFASLLAQVVQAKGYASPALMDLYQEYKPHSGMVPPSRKMKEILRSEISGYETYLVLDALDEYSTADYNSAQRLIAAIRALNVKTLITSRKHVDLDPGTFSELEIRAHQEDVRALVDHHLENNLRLARLIRSAPSLKEEIISKLTINANGMFILVHLHLEWISGLLTIKAIRDALERLPGALDGALELTMERIKNQPAAMVKIAIEVISWVFFGKRRLKVVEIRHAVSFSRGMQSITDDQVLQIEDILDFCAGMVVIVTEDDNPGEEKIEVCQFDHFSTKEFFDRNWERYFPDAQRKITEKSLWYATVAVAQTLPLYPHWQADTYQDAIGYIRATFPLCIYATTYWGSHAYDVNEKFNRHLVSRFCNQGWLIAYIADRISGVSVEDDEASEQKWISPHDYLVLYLARYGLFSLFQQHWDMGTDHTNDGIYDACGWQSIHFATRFGHLAIVSYLVQHGVDLNAKAHRNLGWTPLHYASSANNHSVTSFLLENGADSTLPDIDGWTPLHHAASSGYHPITEMLLENGANPNVQDKHGWSPLRLAASNGHISIVKLLLESRADPNVQDKDGLVPLHLAASYGRHSIVQMLLEHGADPNVRDEDGCTSLHHEAASGHHPIAQMLLENRADPNILDENGWTPLHRAAYYNHDSIVQLLLKSCEDIDAGDKDGRTPLRLAASNGHRTIAQLLLESGAHPNVQDEDGCTPLHCAAYHGHNSTIQLLLGNGADPNIQDEDNTTALQHYLALDVHHKHDLKTVSTFLENGAEPLIPEGWDNMALTDVRNANRLDIAKMLEVAEQTRQMQLSSVSAVDEQWDWARPQQENIRPQDGLNSIKRHVLDVLDDALWHSTHASNPDTFGFKISMAEKQLELVQARLNQARESCNTLANDIQRQEAILISITQKIVNIHREERGGLGG